MNVRINHVFAISILSVGLAVFSGSVNAVGYQVTMISAAQTIAVVGDLSRHSSNEMGDVIENGLDTDGYPRAFLRDHEGKLIDLGTLEGTTSAATAINDKGEIVGKSQTARGTEHAFLWTREGGMMDMGTLGGTWSSASVINDNGQVVGTSAAPSGEKRAFLWNSTQGVVNLDYADGVRDSGWWLTAAWGIDNAGRIVAEGVNAQGQTGLLLLTPVDGLNILPVTERVLRKTMAAQAMAQCPYEGNYKGTWKLEYGPSGPWNFRVNSACAITGTGINEDGYKFSFTGNVSYDGSLTITLPSGGSGSGSISGDGIVSGVAYTDGDKSTITGKRISSAKTKITGLSQKKGKPGDIVSIFGSNFGDFASGVRFGKVNAEIVEWDNNQITVVVPDIATGPKGKSVKVKVRSGSGKPSKAKKFKVLPATGTGR